MTAIVILWGPGVGVRRGLVLDGYQAWLSWTGLVATGATLAGASALRFQPELFPGAPVYGLLVSAVQVWSVALGTVLWRRAGVAAAGGEHVIP